MTSRKAAILLVGATVLGWALGYEQEKGTVTMLSHTPDEVGLTPPPPPPASRRPPRGGHLPPRDLRAAGTDARYLRPVKHGHGHYPSWIGHTYPGHGFQGYPGLHGAHRPHGYHGYHGHHGYPRPGFGTIHAHGHTHIGPHGIRFHGHIKHKPPKKKPFKHKHKHKRRHQYNSWLF